MKNQSICISQNLTFLRQYHKFTQEEVAGKIGVSRQAVAKWETGETIPDLMNCAALAELYEVSMDDLLHYNQTEKKIAIPPKGKHVFGTVKLGERGQVVLPKKARDIFGLQPGDLLVVLGDEDPERGGLALVPGDAFVKAARFVYEAITAADGEPEERGEEE